MQQFGDAVFEPFQVERLGEKIVGMQRHGAFGHFAGKRAHKNHRRLFGGRLAAQNFADGQPIEVGQQNIEQDQIRFELPRLAQRLHAVVGHDEFATQPGEAVLHQLDEIELVIHNQNEACTRRCQAKRMCVASSLWLE